MSSNVALDVIFLDLHSLLHNEELQLKLSKMEYSE